MARTERAGEVEAPQPRMRYFAPSSESVASVRRMVAGHLCDASTACRDAAVCIASELAANAVLHAGTAYVVEVKLGDVVRIEVSDTGPQGSFLVPLPPTVARGLGLFIVSELAARWGVEWLEECKVVWAEVSLDAPSRSATEDCASA